MKEVDSHTMRKQVLMKRGWIIFVVLTIAFSMLLAGLTPFLLTLIALPLGFGLPVGVNWWLQVLLSILAVSMIVWGMKAHRDYEKTTHIQDTDE